MAAPPESNQSQPQPFEWLEELNEAQLQAVCHGDGPLLIVAGAGSGKTRTLAYRVAYLIATGIDPARILLLTFTRRAAEEMIRRATGIVKRGTRATGKVWGGTFHSIASRLLRTYGRAAGVEPNFTVLDQADAQDLIDVVRHEMGLHSRKRRFPRKQTCLAIYSRKVSGDQSLNEVIDRHFPWCSDWKKELRGLFKAYVKRKQQWNVLDYDDLLLYLVELLKEPQLAKRIGGRFEHILVDEYQDTNRAQAAILQGLRQENHNITVVGDDAQSIYAFRAASVENMFDFPKQFKGTTIVTLERNYRSLPPILETTNRLISQARQRYSKALKAARKGGERPKLVTCRDDQSQDEYLIERILQHYEQGVGLRNQAVLFRAAHLSNTLEVELARHNIPYHKYGGLKFVEAAHVKDLIAFLRIRENPRDEIAWFRVLQLIDGIGPAIASKALNHVAANQYDPRSVGSYEAPAGAREGISQLAELFEQLAEIRPSNPAMEVETTRQAYEPILKRRYENPQIRMSDLENLERIASRYQSRRSFLIDLQLDPPTSTSDLAGPPLKDEDWLVLSTIHSAKGCEWNVVYLIHAADGCLPSDMSTGSRREIEEELRLAYVAMTRAKDALYVTWPIRYYHRRSAFTDRHSYAQLSRFISAEVKESMDLLTASPQDDLEGETDPTTAGLDIRDRIRSMWD